jgi:hypothetical protein
MTVSDVVSGTSELVGKTVTDVMVLVSTISLAIVVGATTVWDATTDVYSDTTTLVDTGCESFPTELYVVVELKVPVTVYDVEMTLPERVKFAVLVLEVTMTLDRVTLKVVVCSGTVTVLVRLIVD